MLDPRFKSLHLVFSKGSLFLVGREEGVSIVNEYDKRTLYLMLLKCYYHLHSMTKFVGCVDYTSDEDSSLDIFQRTAFTSKPSKELVIRELLNFKHYQLDHKDIKRLLQW